MKNFNRVSIATALISSAISVSAHATDILNLTPASQLDPVSGYELDLSATETVTGMNKTLTLVGDGVRAEPVPIFGMKNIYLAQFLAETPTALVRDVTNPTAVLGSLTAAGAKAIRLTFIFSPIPVNKIRFAFSNSLIQNMTTDEQTTYSDDVNAFLDTVSAAGFSRGTSITIFGYTKADGTEDVVYEDTNGTVTSMASLKPIVPGFVNKVFSIWLGNTAYDANLQQLEKSLLTAPVGLTPRT
jgi:hypothetical protein